MTITFSPDMEAQIEKNARAEGVSIATYIERLRADEDWRELTGAEAALTIAIGRWPKSA